ncbi:unnamed protein product [Allacma fusca]|uniref:BED-type domain-containing protein n=1 Tax=Allacma fusca TaxID=39272 RepID=A0A8J2JT80_9HEXA|nr:unnamed protein product [Allacma fusca]
MELSVADALAQLTVTERLKQCNYCSTRLKKDPSGSTGNLMKHIKRFHKNINIGGSDPEPEGPLKKYFKAAHGFNEVEFENRLLDFIVMDNLPYAVGNSSFFKTFALYGRDTAKAIIPSSSTIKRKLSSRYEVQKQELKTILKEAPGKLSLIRRT